MDAHTALGRSVVETLRMGQTSEVVVANGLQQPGTRVPVWEVYPSKIVMTEDTAKVSVELCLPAEDGDEPPDFPNATIDVVIRLDNSPDPMTPDTVGAYLSVLLAALPGLLPVGRMVKVTNRAR